MKNQFGQEIRVGSWVGHAYKTGSLTLHHVGQVRELAQKQEGWNYQTYEKRYSPALKVRWLPDGHVSTIYADRAFVLDTTTLDFGDVP